METNTATPPNEVEQILALISDVNGKVRVDDSLTYISDEQYDRLKVGINDLTINIYNHKLVSEKSKDRLDTLTDMMISMASLDFSKKAPVGEEENHLDYLAIGLNLMSHQLNKAVNPLLENQEKLKAMHGILKELVGKDDDGMSKREYKEAMKMIVEELEPMTEKAIN